MGTRRLITLGLDDHWGPSPPHASDGPSRRRASWLERILLFVGVILLGYYGLTTMESYLYQWQENRELDAILEGPVPTTGTDIEIPPPPRRPPPAQGTVVGRIEIPRLGVSTIIRSGTDAKTLRLAVGHISGTAFPGEPGNIGLAAHRDTFFRRLRDIKVNDDIRVATPDGTFTFRVFRTTVVWPSETWVLDPSTQPTLTLVTCYPFTYVGSAPQRFIVSAAAMPPQLASGN